MFDRNAYGAGIYVWNYRERLYGDGRHFFEPDGLPNAGGRRVPDAFGLADLFAAGLPVGVGGVGNAHNQILFRFARLDSVGDVECEGIVAAGVLADLVS